MSKINAFELSQKISLLPVHLLQEVNDYIEFLTFKSSQKDWADNLTNNQKTLIEKGKNDIEENKVITHKGARKLINKYINKTK